jgi:uncharacterized protein (TIGR03083 family)
MEPARFLECLDDDFSRMREVAARDLTAAVPSCPGWSVADLVQHTATVFLHKVECMQRAAGPETPWPPPGLDSEEPLALFDRAYAGLVGEFSVRAPADPSATWYPPEQTVGFWIRRMAQETVIHRVDAELALREPLAPIASDLAIDGVDEVLVRFLSFATTNWAAEFDALKECDGQTVAVRAGDRSWSAQLTDAGVVMSEPAGEADANVTGEPDAVLLWLWRRTGDETIAIEGDRSAVDMLHGLLGATTV